MSLGHETQIRPHRPCWPNGRSEYLSLSLSRSDQATSLDRGFHESSIPICRPLSKGTAASHPGFDTPLCARRAHYLARYILKVGSGVPALELAIFWTF